MLHYVQQLVASFICVPFGVGQVAYSGVLMSSRWKQLCPTFGNDTDESDKKLFRDEGNCRVG